MATAIGRVTSTGSSFSSPLPPTGPVEVSIINRIRSRFNVPVCAGDHPDSRT